MSIPESTSSTTAAKIPKPDWLRVKLPIGKNYLQVRSLVDQYNLHTICQSGNCPNMGECWGAGTATFMILGNICTRSCGFCNVFTGRPTELDWDEPRRVAEAIQLMKVKHAVITSVNRDELSDGGASIWASTINAVRAANPETTMETLIPDFMGKTSSLDLIIEAHPHVVSHNIETVERLTKQVRVQAKYARSMEVISYLKKGGMRTKSGIMLGLGESFEEVIQTITDLHTAGCDVLTVGQYLQPTTNHLPVARFVPPAEFAEIKLRAHQIGFKRVESGPLVRSSYHSENHLFDELV
jgi:lipoyl synthase